MSTIHRSGTARRPFALVTLLATGATGVALEPTAAQATTYGSATSPVTILGPGGQVSVVGGGTVSLPPGAHDISWSGNGGRIAYIVGNQVFTADYDGRNQILVATAGSGPPSHTVWDSFGQNVIWSEPSYRGGHPGHILQQAAADGSDASADPAQRTSPVGGALMIPNDYQFLGQGQSWADVAGDPADSIVFQIDSFDTTSMGISVSSWSGGREHITPVVGLGTASTGGAQPTISPDGKAVVFVRTDANGDQQLFASILGAGGTWGTATQVTFTPHVDHTAPMFEVDGKTIAFTATPKAGATAAAGTYTAVLPPAGATVNAESQISPLTGGAQIRTDLKQSAVRFAGANRFDTAVRASRALWRSNGDTADTSRAQAQTVVLSRSDNFADALGGAGLAAHKHGPLLLTDTAALTAQAGAEIRRILPAGATVYLLGGTAAISPQVQAQLTAMGYIVVRIAGANRFDTAVQVAKATSPNPTLVLIADGTKPSDALSAGAVAASMPGVTVVLTNGTQQPIETAEYVTNLRVGNDPNFKQTIEVGGPAAVAYGRVWSLDVGNAYLIGADRFQTSFLVAKAFFNGAGGVGVATGLNWPDSLAGGAFMGRQYGPLLLVDPTGGLTAEENTWIDSQLGSVYGGYVFGGDAALPPNVASQLANDVRTAANAGSGTVVQAP